MNDAADTVTLSRAEYEALIERIEDTEDLAALDRFEARIAAEGADTAFADCLPIDLAERLCIGEHPIRVWREHRGLTREALAAAAGVSPTCLTEIETRQQTGGFDAIARLAAALRISLDDVAAWLKPRD